MSTRGRRRGGGNSSSSSNRRGNEQTLSDTASDTQRGRRNGGQRAGSETPSGAQSRGSNSNLFGASPMGAQGSTPAAVGDVRTRLERIRASRPKLRQQFIRQGLMNPEGQMHLKDAVKLIGICTEMCPEYERVRRIVENDVKAPECTPETEHLPRSQRIPDESRMVKAYARSAAGVDVELVSELRSPITCLSTINYLFERLDHDDFEYLQNWIWDRTRSVRKDLRTQSITSRPDIKIYLTCLERIARYHLISMHQMAKSKKDDYDHQQDLEQLNQTIMSLKERYADNRRAGIPSDNEAEFWAIRLILAPQYVTNQLEYEVHRLPSDIRNNGRVQVAIELYRLLKSVLIARSTDYIQCQANWKKLWELVKSPRVSYLMACAAEVSFNRVRHVVLNSLWRAYRVGNAKITIVVDDWTTDKLKDALGLDTDQEAVQLCENFGFEFGVNKAGKTFLDLTKKGYSYEVLSKPLDVKSQSFSAKMVEIKRHGRAFSAIIHGMSVKEAKSDGHIINAGPVEEMEDESTLFVPETSTTKSSIFTQQPNGVGAATAKTPFNPFASAFQPSNAPTATSNPFLKAASDLQQQGLPPTGPLTSGIQPGLFDPSKNPIQFSATSTTSSGAVSSHSSTPASSGNPFLKGANTPQTAPGGIFTSAPPTAPVNPFPSTPSTAQANPFAKFAPTNPQPPRATTTPSNSPFAFPSFKKPNEETPQQSTPPESSFAPVGPPPQEFTATQEVARQKVELEKRNAAEKEKQEAEARKRVLDAQRARAAQEAEQRRAAEIEQQKRQAAVEAEQRRRQLQADQERRAREEQERLVREEQQRQAQKEEARMTERRERDLAFRALTNNIMFDPEQGLLAQFIENAAINMAQQVILDEQKREQERRAAVLRENRRQAIARAVMVHWLRIVEKKKRAEQARQRRKRIKEQRRLANTEQTMVTVPSSPKAPTAEAQLNGALKNIQPTAPPANTRRARRTKERHGNLMSKVNGVSQTISHEEGSGQATTQIALVPTNLSNSKPPVLGYSQAYQKSTAPIDRTETDWFELRAMGIDPSKHRKRSFSYDSTSSDEEKKPQIESKRPRLSPTLNDNDHHQLGQPALTAEEDQLARFRAVKQAFRTSGSALQLANAYTTINGTVSTNAWPSAHKKSSSLVAKARELVANSPTTQHSPPNVQHDWGRSVPNFGLSASVSSGSVFGKSVSASAQNDRPAYWARASRFVPKHLYGQGAQAIQAYYKQYVNKSASSSVRSMSGDFPAQASSNPTQQSHNPQPGYTQGGFSQPHYDENEVAGVADALNAFLPDNSALAGNVNPFLPEAVYDANAYPFAHGIEYSNETEEEPGYEEEIEDDEDDLDGDDYGTVHHGQAYVHPQDDSEQDEYDEYSDEEEDEEDTAPPVRGQYLQPVSQQFSHRQHSAAPSTQQAKQPLGQAGTTEDDAIELSD